jgi:lycopene beta-cyclase
MSAKCSDFVFAGGGLAGLSLACGLARSPLRQSKILIVEPNPGQLHERIWCYWAELDRTDLFAASATRTWHQLRVAWPESDRLVGLGRYRYRMIRGSDFYACVRQQLAGCPDVTWLEGHVEQVHDLPEGARVIVNGQAYSGRWVFDSRPNGLARVEPAAVHMRFRGWEVEAPRAVFDPGAPSFLDFRTPQKNDARFFYVLPLSARRAIVEYTLFSAARLGRGEAEAALRQYLQVAWGLAGFRVLREEAGSLPLSARSFPRRLGAHVMAIGLNGGLLKPTTGFAFRRIQDDTAAIVRSLVETGAPWRVPATPWRYRLYDALMLRVMHRRGAQISAIFEALMAGNGIERVLAFLDERDSVRQDLALIASLPPGPFLSELLSRGRPGGSGPIPQQHMMSRSEVGDLP